MAQDMLERYEAGKATLNELREESGLSPLPYESADQMLIKDEVTKVFPLPDNTLNRQAKLVWEIVNGIRQCDKENAMLIITHSLQRELESIEAIMEGINALSDEVRGCISHDLLNELKCKRDIFHQFITMANAM